MAIGLKFHHSCVNCDGVNTDFRNEKGLPCEICLPDEESEPNRFLTRPGYLNFIWKFKDEYENVLGFFREKIGSDPNGFQRIWIRRVLLGKSFTAIAPTGMGKTTFGTLMASYFSKTGKRSMLVLPTVLLVDQTVERLVRFSASGVAFYHSKMKKRDREINVERIEKGDFRVLVVSNQFLSKKFDLIRVLKFDFVFVDDVDAVLKSSKNIDRLLMILGFDDEDIDLAYRKVKGEDVEIPNKDHGTLVVSSATAKPRGIRHLLFRYLLGFDIGRLVVASRNVENVRMREKSVDKLLEIVDLLKDGVLIFTRSSEDAGNVRSALEKSGIKVGGDDEESFEEFAMGGLNALVGVSSYYGKLVRGLDLPERIKFTVFFGTPVFEYPLDRERAPRFVLRRVLRELSKMDEKYAGYLRMVDKVRDLNTFRKSLDIPGDLWWEKVREVFGRFRIVNDTLIIPDVLTYIQASGRTSRFTMTGLTKGVSVLMEEDDVIFENLRERLEWLVEEVWSDFEDVDWKRLLEEVEKSREFKKKKPLDFESVLFVVESPTKAGTLSGFFGRSSTRVYKGIMVHESIFDNKFIAFTASRGHVYDLVTEGGVHGVDVENGRFVPVYNTIKRCRGCGYQFTEDTDRCPRCGNTDLDDKTDALKSLRELALEVDRVIVATDPDTEGEKISYDVYQYLKPINSDISRVELHEITRNEFRKGLEDLRGVNTDLVKAQIVRRVQDRWIGFELSGEVQKEFKKANLSAGRVQSTVLGWIVEREREYAKSEKVFTSVMFEGRKLEIEGELRPEKIEVIELEEFDEELKPLPPFTTDSILSEASKRFKMSAVEVMNILQDLFERGFITYHRTDSMRISQAGQGIARRIFERLKLDVFQPRGWGEGGAHEAIRPSKPLTPEELIEMVEEGVVKDITRKHVNVYGLIFKRFLVSQAKNSKIRKQRVKLKVNGSMVEDEVISEVIENGWNLIEPLEVFKYKEKKYNIEEYKTYKKHTVPLFTQATLIEEMKKRGIGRPSTYAKIVDVLFQRRYVFEDRYGRLRPTKLGKGVYTFLKENFPEFVTDETTRKLEEVMDEVEEGKKDYQEVLKAMLRDLESIRSRRTSRSGR